MTVSHCHGNTVYMSAVYVTYSSDWRYYTKYRTSQNFFQPKNFTNPKGGEKADLGKKFWTACEYLQRESCYIFYSYNNDNSSDSDTVAMDERDNGGTSDEDKAAASCK